LKRWQLKRKILSSIQEFDTAQLSAARAAAWHQNGEAILTLEAARAWIAERGIVLFAPRPAQLPAPAPSLVEATLGAANEAPTAAETAAARSLLARMVADGVALPMNLLGVPGDVADFVVSAQVFSYVFTLRGDKAWKQPPSTSGAISVSPLGLHIYEVLAAAEKGRGAMSAAELATELGREVTETAIQRALSELWSQLRVLPLLDQGSGVTLWELTTRRFTKAIKAGANAGVPSALSALISLYLAQAITASDDDVATFLSPLTARSRVREVLRALTSARQLETATVDGKTLLHIPGSLPAFAAAEDAEPVEGEGEGDEAALPRPKKIGTGRISSFTSETKSPNEFRGKAVKTKSFGARAESAGSRAKPASKFGPRSTEGKPDRERRPFKKDGAGSLKSRSANPTFSKPWDEDRKPRAAAAPADSFTKFRRPEKEDREPLSPREQKGLPEERRTAERKATQSFEKRTFDGKPVARKPFGAKPAFGSKPAFGAKPAYGAKPAFGSKPSFGSKPAFGSRPSFGPKKPYAPRTTADDADRPAFKPRSFEGPGKTFEKKPYERKPYERKDNASKTSFPGKPAFGAKRAYTPRTSEDGERPAFKPRTSEGGERPAFKPRTFDGPSQGFEKKPYEKKPYEGKPFAAKTDSDEKRPYSPRKTEGGFGEKRPYSPRSSEGGGRSFSKPGFAKRPFVKRVPDATMLPEGAPVERTLAKRPHKPRAADADKRAFTKDPWVPPTDSGEGKRPFKSRSGGGGFKKPFGGKKPGGARGFSSRKKPE
jgi:23S rRNA pseudouridine2605 synthase